MTTILADAKLGLMAADSSASNGIRVWSSERKVWRVRGHLLGFAGSTHLFPHVVSWFRRGGTSDDMPKLEDDTSVLILGPTGLYLLDHNSRLPQHIACGREAIGTGANTVIAVHEALGWSDPRKAVQITCRHDASSRAPVRLYRLSTRKATQACHQS